MADLDEINKELNSIAKEVTKEAVANYQKIRRIFKNEYQLPEVDPLRFEICLCLTLGLYQAAITLTNHLLEKYLKIALIYVETNQKITVENVEGLFKQSVDNYSNKDLSTTINACCTKGIITKAQKKDLEQFKNRIRNPFSHADMKKTFEGMTIPAQIGKIDYNSKENILKVEREFNITINNFPPFQGIAQAIMAKEISFSYFEYLDNLIRTTLNKIIK